MTAIPGRALHYVFKIGDRAKNAFFFRQILGMKVSGSRGAMVGWSVGGTTNPYRESYGVLCLEADIFISTTCQQRLG